jgi:hypothetical protein
MESIEVTCYALVSLYFEVGVRHGEEKRGICGATKLGFWDLRGRGEDDADHQVQLGKPQQPRC